MDDRRPAGRDALVQLVAVDIAKRCGEPRILDHRYDPLGLVDKHVLGGYGAWPNIDPRGEPSAQATPHPPHAPQAEQRRAEPEDRDYRAARWLGEWASPEAVRAVERDHEKGVQDDKRDADQ